MQISFKSIFERLEDEIKSHIKSRDLIEEPIKAYRHNKFDISLILKEKVLEVTLEHNGRDSEISIYNFQINPEFLKLIQYNTIAPKSLCIKFKNLRTIPYDGTSVISNKSKLENVSVEVEGSSFNKLVIEGDFTEISLDRVHFNHMDITSICSKLNIEYCRPYIPENHAGLRIASNRIDSLNIEENKNLGTITIRVDSIISTKYKSNTSEIFSLVGCKIHVLDFLNNTANKIELKDIHAIPNLTNCQIMLKQNLNIKSLLLDKLDFGDTSLSFNYKKLSLSKHANMSLILCENTIDNLILNDINWDYKGINNLTEYKYYPKKEALLSLKSAYSKQQDSYHEKVFQSYEKRWHHDKKTNFPLSLSWYSNEFGLSMLRPILWLILFIALEITLIVSLSFECSHLFLNDFGNFFYLINPAHNTNIFLDVIKDTYCESYYLSNGIKIIDNVFRIFIGYMLFQFINAFRYKHDLK